MFRLRRRRKPGLASLVDLSAPVWSESKDADTIRLLYMEVNRLSRNYLTPDHWIMSPDWYQELKGLKDAYGVKYWIPPVHNGAEYLIGIPVYVHPWAGRPALVARESNANAA